MLRLWMFTYCLVVSLKYLFTFLHDFLIPLLGRIGGLANSSPIFFGRLETTNPFKRTSARHASKWHRQTVGWRLAARQRARWGHGCVFLAGRVICVSTLKFNWSTFGECFDEMIFLGVDGLEYGQSLDKFCWMGCGSMIYTWSLLVFCPLINPLGVSQK